MSTDIEIRIHIERKIVRAVVTEAIANGYTVTHNDGVNNTVTVSAPLDIGLLMDQLHATDEEYLIINHADGKRAGSVMLVYGNDGYDVIADHTASPLMDKIIKPADIMARKMEVDSYVGGK
jgi:hypothetical protein